MLVESPVGDCLIVSLDDATMCKFRYFGQESASDACGITRG